MNPVSVHIIYHALALRRFLLSLRQGTSALPTSSSALLLNAWNPTQSIKLPRGQDADLEHLTNNVFIRLIRATINQVGLAAASQPASFYCLLVCRAAVCSAPR